MTIATDSGGRQQTCTDGLPQAMCAAALVARAATWLRDDDDPVNRVTTYIPWPIAKGTGLLQDEVLHRFGIHGILEEQHHKMTRLREEVSTRMPKPEETRLLRLRPEVPVLDVWHTSIDHDGQPYELTRFVMRSDMTGLLYDVPVE